MSVRSVFRAFGSTPSAGPAASLPSLCSLAREVDAKVRVELLSSAKKRAEIEAKQQVSAAAAAQRRASLQTRFLLWLVFNCNSKASLVAAD